MHVGEQNILRLWIAMLWQLITASALGILGQAPSSHRQELIIPSTSPRQRVLAGKGKLPEFRVQTHQSTSYKASGPWTISPLIGKDITALIVKDGPEQNAEAFLRGCICVTVAS